jgi:tetratricopeptide (TPR) repeat protein
VDIRSVLGHKGSTQALAGPPGTLVPGTVLAARFEVVRFLGRGGMGDVYEARDRQLGERVALKTLRHDVADDPESSRRFQREIHLARRVTHPNVCRIYDVFQHSFPDDAEHGWAGRELAFLSMELLQGENLTEYLKRHGPLTPEAAFPIAEQLAGALEAAHRSAVVHRDFKCANVLLMDAGGERQRAVVTDFGLALSSAGGTLAATLTARGQVLGSPAYMAPEQVRGERATAASDIYALGVVLYEMVTGRQPFEAPSAIEVAFKRLKFPPVSPRQYQPDLPEVWEAVILRCLALDPAERFETPAAMVAALQARTSRPRGRWRLPAAVAFLLAAAVVVGLFVLQSWRQGPEAPSDGSAVTVPVPTERTGVTVFPFRALAPDPERGWLGTAAAELLRSELGASPELRLTSGEVAQRLEREMALPAAASFGAETLARIQQNTAGEYVAVGSFLALARDGVRLSVNLQSAASGETVASHNAEGPVDQLPRLVAELAQALRGSLELGAVPMEEAAGAQAARPVTADALRLYAEGVERLRLHDPAAARKLLEQATAADPGNALAWSALAESRAALGFDREARDAAGEAVAKAERLGRASRLAIEARAAEIRREYPAAVALYRQLLAVDPGNLEQGLRLAAAQTAGGAPAEALATVEALRALPAPVGEDPRIDLAAAEAYRAQGQFQLQRDTARAAGMAAKERGATLLEASAGQMEGLALRNLGQLPEAVAASEAAYRIFQAAGDRGAAALTQRNIAIATFMQGDVERAEALFLEVLATFREIGDERGTATALNNLGNFYLRLGDRARAEPLIEDALEGFRRIADLNSQARALANLAEIDRQNGNLTRSETRVEEAVNLIGAVRDASGQAGMLVNLAGLRMARGDVAAARESLQTARRLYGEIGEKENLAAAEMGLGEAAALLGEWEEGRERLAAARALRQELEDAPGAAEVELAAARLELATGAFREAEGLSAAAARAFSDADLLEMAAAAEAVRARALLAQGEVPLAENALATARARLPDGAGPTAEIQVTLAAAELALAQGDARRVVAPLRRLVEDAGNLPVDLRLELEITLGRAEQALGRTSGVERLRRAEREARRLGLKPLAARARE